MSWLPLFKLRLGRAIFAILHCRYLFLLYRSTPFPPRSPVRQCPSESNEGAVIVGGSDMGTDFGEFRLGHPIRILLRVFLLGRLSVSASFGQETTTVSRVRSPETGDNRVVSAQIGTGDRSKSSKEGRFGIRD